MSFESYYLNSGILNVATPLDEAKLRAIDRKLRVVQFETPLNERDCQILAEFMKEHPQVVLRAFDLFAFRITDLEFLRHFSSIKKFQCNLWKLPSFDGLAHLSNELEELHLGRTRSKALSLKILDRFPNLKVLYVEGHTKHANVIGTLSTLEDLTLRSVTFSDLDFLRPLRNLWSLDIKLGGTKDLSALPDIGLLKYVELWMIRGLDDLTPIGAIPTLQYLFLQSLKQVRELPPMTRLSSLRRIHIEDLKGLVDLAPIRNAPALEELTVSARHLQPHHFLCLKNHPTLKRASIGLGSDRKNREVENILSLPRISYGTEFTFQ
jgi:hypothetical protein